MNAHEQHYRSRCRAARTRLRAVPPGVDRVLLPHARLRVRSRRRRTGSTRARLARLRWFRGPRRVALVALSHRQQRLLRHAERQATARDADRLHERRQRVGTGRTADQREHMDRSDPRRSRPPRHRRPGRRDDRARVGTAGVHHRAAAPPAASARGADPARSPQMEGQRSRGVARHDSRVRQQRAPARSGDTRRARHRNRSFRFVGPVRSRAASPVGALPGRVRTVRHRLARHPVARRRHDVDASVPALAARIGRVRHLDARPR